MIHAIEELLQTHIFPDLQRGRKDFDLSHTQATVHWMKQIVRKEPHLDGGVLITAAYAHDWGYIDMGIENSLDHIHEAKRRHMEVGSLRIYELLHTPQLEVYFSDTQIERVRHLVAVHDQLEEISAEDEIALMEADTLGALDTELVKPTFSREDNERYITEQVLGRRRPLFRHQVAIDTFATVLERRLQYYSTTL